MELDDIIAKLTAMPEAAQREACAQAFEATKDMVFVPSPGPQFEAYVSEADVLLFGGSPGGGKLLDSSTYVPVTIATSPTGFKLHGELEPGDYVYGKFGQPVRVLERHPFVDDAKSYELTFSTGEKVIACAEHLWETWNRDERLRALRTTPDWREKRKAQRVSRAKADVKNLGRQASVTRRNRERQYEIAPATPTVRTTQELYDTCYVGKEQRVNHAIKIVEPVGGGEAVLPWEPYLFGLWLGDGMTAKPEIIMMDSDWAVLRAFTPGANNEKHECKSKQPTTIRRFNTALQGVNHLQGGKHIPAAYRRASYAQRMALLQGMMDTDGTVDVRGHCELGFSNKRLAQDALEVINSLGIKAAIRTKKMNNDNHATHYRMKFIPEVPVFRLPRKAQRQKQPERGTTGFRYIEKIEPCEPVRMNCLTVEGGLYCFRREFIVTHNTALEVGLALNQHHRSLIVRKNFVDLGGVLHTLDNILGKENSAVGGNRPVYRKPEGGIIEFMGIGENIDSKQGNPHDGIFVDEAAQVSEHDVRMLMGWMRTDIKGQRCRMVLGSNPPLNSTGDWLITYFAPWLDPHYPNPAQEGELRYFLPDPEGGADRECGKDDFVLLHGVQVPAQSRTFISSKFTDNPFYDKEQYAKSLAGLPIEAREILVSGNFLTDRSDDAFQAIPTQWVKEAQERWSATPPVGVPLCAIGADVAQGGNDRSVLAKRYDAYYAKLEVKPGKDTPDGKTYGGWVIANRHNNAKVILDIGGGWGGDAYAHLRENGVDAVGYMGVKVTSAKTADNLLGFTNVRSMAYWRFREALDPSQPGGARIALPPDPEMVADLCAPTYEVVSAGTKGARIKIEPKEDVCDRLKRSTDKGDAVVMAWVDGLKMSNMQGGDWSTRKRTPKVLMRRR